MHWNELGVYYLAIPYVMWFFPLVQRNRKLEGTYLVHLFCVNIIETSYRRYDKVRVALSKHFICLQSFKS